MLYAFSTYWLQRSYVQDRGMLFNLQAAEVICTSSLHAFNLQSAEIICTRSLYVFQPAGCRGHMYREFHCWSGKMNNATNLCIISVSFGNNGIFLSDGIMYA